jgi:small subunit ribosomal protein S4
MGDPKRKRKRFERPRKPWDKQRLEEEKKLRATYGFETKKELWRVETTLRRKRHVARSLLALPLEERLKREKELLQSLNRLGMVSENASLDDILGLNLPELLERRLQTLVWRKGLANTVKQARQFIVHGHIAIDGKKATSPSRLVTREEEAKISYYGKPMVLAQPKKEKKTREEIKKDFEESAAGAEAAEAEEIPETEAAKEEAAEKE